jgi:hypothetical protein
MRAADPTGPGLDHLAAAGPSNIDDLRVELDSSQGARSLRRPSSAAARSSRVIAVTAGEGHTHSSELARWDHVFIDSGDVGVHLHQAFQQLLLAGVRAAVMAPEAELKRWFSWRWYWEDSLVEDLVRDGRLRRVDGHVTMVA